MGVQCAGRQHERPGRRQARERLESRSPTREQTAVREREPHRLKTLSLGKRVEKSLSLRVFQPEERELPEAIEPCGEPRRTPAELSAGVVEQDGAGDDVAHDREGTFAP
jgi:hypothetical protein